jgi:hypothetical protein
MPLYSSGVVIGRRARSVLITILRENWNMETGIVKWFNDAKTLGFIKATSGDDRSAHFSEIRAEGLKSFRITSTSPSK